MILEVKPPVDMQEYEFNYDRNSNHLTWVRNRITNSDIMFYNMELTEMQGYVTNSVVDIWTN